MSVSLGTPLVRRERTLRKRTAAQRGVTDYELRILLWLSRGKRYAEIAEILTEQGMPHTAKAVKTHASRLMTKLAAPTIGGLVGRALREELIS